MGRVIGVFGDSVCRIGHFPQPSARVIRVVDRSPDVVSDLGDAVARIARKVYESPARASDLGSVSIGIAGDCQSIAIAICYAEKPGLSGTRRLKAILEVVNSAILELDFVTGCIPGNF